MSERNYGIDLLRIVSMIGVMMLHILGHGGVLSCLKVLSVNYNVAWLLEICAYCAVDCFVLISGFIGVQSKVRYANLVCLWFETEIYSVGIMIFFTSLYGVRNIKECIISFFPVTMTQYWFFSMYVGMMLMAPVLNTFVNKTKLSFALPTLVIMTLLYAGLSIMNENVFELSGGYSVIWFLILYLWGGIICKIKKVYQFNLKRIKFTMLILTIITWILKLSFEAITLKVFGETKGGSIFIKYTSPFVLCVAIGLLIVFSEFKCKKIIPTLRYLTPLTFSAYLIQDNKYIREYCVKNAFGFLAEKNIFVLVLGVVVSSIICFGITTTFDLIRFFIFKRVGIKYRIQKYEIRIQNCLKYKLNKLDDRC